jgi:hypothetical protein
MTEEKEEQVQLKLERNENKVTLSFLNGKEEREFSTEEDAEKAEHLAALVINMVQWLVNNGAKFISSEIETDEIQEETT